jgi:hypothetical protein
MIGLLRLFALKQLFLPKFRQRISAKTGNTTGDKKHMQKGNKE